MKVIGYALITAPLLLHFSLIDWEAGGAELVEINGYGFSPRPTFVEKTPARFGVEERVEVSHLTCAIFGLAIPVVVLSLGLSIVFGEAIKQNARQYIHRTASDVAKATDAASRPMPST